MLGCWLVFSSVVGLFFGLWFFSNLPINKIFSHKKKNTSFNYDVFISFRGIDTRSSFTASLYRILCQNGIRTFLDEKKLQPGNHIRTSLLKAIQESKIAIVVLSENYASSSFCLDELVDILNHCSKNKDISVWPIFYKVKPCDVRHQRGNFREALDKHKKNHEDRVLKKWKQALNKVANLSGFIVKQGNESKDDDTIQKIVERVIKHAPLQGQRLLDLHKMINKMMKKRESSKEQQYTFKDEHNKRTIQLKLTVELIHQQTNKLKNIHVKIQLKKQCHFGEQFFIVGNHHKLGSWKPSNALPMTWSEGDVWTASLDILAGESIQFKFILKGPIVWQPGPDRILQPLENVSGVTICEDWENAEYRQFIQE